MTVLGGEGIANAPARVLKQQKRLSFAFAGMTVAFAGIVARVGHVR